MRIRILSIMVVLSVLTARPLGAQAGEKTKAEKTEPDRYTGIAMPVGGSGRDTSVTLDFNIKRYTTDRESNEFRGILKEGGTSALLRVMERLNLGQVSSPGGTGYPIALARTRRTDKATQVEIVILMRQLSRSVEYPFRVFKLFVNEKGSGEGTIIPQAKAKLDKEGRLSWESFGYGNTPLIKVRRF